MFEETLHSGKVRVEVQVDGGRGVNLNLSVVGSDKQERVVKLSG